MAKERPKPTGSQIAMMAGGGLVGALIATVVLNVGGAVMGALIGLGVALGGMPYFRAMGEWKKNQDE